MATKHQTECYRVFDGKKFTNFCDVLDPSTLDNVIKEARKQYKYMRKIKHSEGYYQIFVFKRIY